MTQKAYGKVNIEITNICNLQCSFCPEIIRDKAMMPVSLFQKIIEQVKPLTDQVCFHLMGEPLAHPELRTFIEICAKSAIPIFFVSNGVLLRDDKAELLLNPIFRQINFSLHSFSDNFPNQDPTLYLERIFKFVERALVERPELYINFRLWNLKDPKGMGAQNQEMLARIEARFGEMTLKAEDIRKKKSHPLKNRLYLHFDTEFTWPSLDLPILGTRGTCYGLSSHFGILADGTVVPCCLDKEGNIPLGKIGDSPLSEVLRSPKAKAILKGFQNRELVEPLCQRCQYIERFGQ